jgi:hypothetical protein
MREFKISTLLLLISITCMLMGSATAQDPNEVPKMGVFFSTEEDFVTRGPVPFDGPIISDGDLLNSAGYVYMRNSKLLTHWDMSIDLGLDAADVIDVNRGFVAFSTELDHPKGLFTAGDLLAINGAVLPNSALLVRFNLPRDLDLGLDAVHFIGKQKSIIEFLRMVKERGRKFWLEKPEALVEYLKKYNINIWFSTEGTAPMKQREQEPRFLDGDLLSAADGTVVGRNAWLLPLSVPAGILKRGVDFGLDAYTAPTREYKTVRERGLFSTEILFEGRPSFTDGDVLLFGNGVVATNNKLVRPFEPKAEFLGLDALSIPIREQFLPCEAVIMRVGGMAAGSIGPNGLANGWSATTPLFEAFDSPFGRWVEILGRMPSCEECVKFKVQYGKWPDSTTPPTSFLPLTDPFKEWILMPWWPHFIRVDRVPSSDGWLNILCDTTMGGLYYPWNTAGKNAKYSLRLTIEDTGGSQYISSPVVLIIDNTRPEASLKFDKIPVCGDIFIGDKVTGKITGIDEHFYSYRLRFESSLASGLILPVRKYTGVSDHGDLNVPFVWDTTGLPPCGYRIILEVWDRTIVNNHRSWGEPGYGWRERDQKYFCLEAAK